MASSMSSTLAGGSDDYNGCDSCGDDTVDYVGYCLDCKDYLCNYCFNSHRKHFRQHVLLDKRRYSSPDQQHASDIVDDRSRKSLNHHHGVQEAISNRPTQPTWKTRITSQKILVAVIVLLMAVWIAGPLERVNPGADNEAVKQVNVDTKTVDPRERINSGSDHKEEENEDDKATKQVNVDTKTVGQRGRINTGSDHKEEENVDNKATKHDNVDAKTVDPRESVNSETDHKKEEQDEDEVDTMVDVLIAELDDKIKQDNLRSKVDHAVDKLEHKIEQEGNRIKTTVKKTLKKLRKKVGRVLKL